MHAIWGIGASQVWAVGGATPVGNTAGKIISQDLKAGAAAGVWTSATIPPTIQTLLDVHGTSATDVWAVGAQNSILQLVSGSWSQPIIKQMLPVADFHGVFVVSEQEVWIVGETTSDASGIAVDLVKDPASSQWQVMRKDAWPSQPLNGIWGNSPDNIWAVGNGGIVLNWNGAQWMQQSPFTGQTLQRIKGSADGSELWTGDYIGRIYRRTAMGWRQENSGTTSSIIDFLPIASGDVWFTAFGGGIWHCTPIHPTS